MTKRKAKQVPSASNQENVPDAAEQAGTPRTRRRRASTENDSKASPVAIEPKKTPRSTPKRKAPEQAKSLEPAAEVSISNRETEETATAADAAANTAAAAAAAASAASAAVKSAPQAKGRKKAKPEPLPVWSPDMRPPPWEGPAFRILSWNVAGLRALMKKDKDVFKRLAAEESADVICVQETKLQNCHTADIEPALQLPGWHKYWYCSDAKAGYAGTAIFSKTKPLGVSYGLGLPEHDDEGRVVTAEYADLFVVDVYTPNSGEGLKRLDYRINRWDQAFCEHVKALEGKGKQVVITGDLNCAHEPIDIHNPKGNERSAGYTVEERESFSERYTSNGLVDTFRAQYPGTVGYSYWTYKFNCRAKNKGWRLDYFLVSEKLMPRVHDSYMLQQVMGSDHCPLGLVVKPAV